MKPCVSLLLGILIGGSCWSLAHGNPVYSVTGVAIGSRIHFDSTAYQEYSCGPSEVFDGLTFCVKKTDDTDQRGSFVAYDGLLHSGDGTVVYVSRYQDPAYWRDGEVKDDIDYYPRAWRTADNLDDADPRRVSKWCYCHVGKNYSGAR